MHFKSILYTYPEPVKFLASLPRRSFCVDIDNNALDITLDQFFYLFYLFIYLFILFKFYLVYISACDLVIHATVRVPESTIFINLNSS